MDRHAHGFRSASLLGALSLCVIALGWPAPAQASFFDVYGFSSRAIARGGSVVALGTDYDAAYYNPANVLGRKRVHLGFGFNLVAPALEVRQVAGAFESRTPQGGAGFHLGMSTPIGGIFDDRVGFGFALFHPLTSGTSVNSVDPGVAHFDRYQALPDKLILAASLAFEPVDWLRVGAGVQILAELRGRVDASLSLAEGRFNRERIDVELVPTFAPTFGLSIGPFEGLRLGLTWRHRLALRYRLPVAVDIAEVGELGVLVDGTSLFTPSQLAFGIGWDSAPEGEAGVSVEVGVTYERWGGAPPAGAAFALTVDDRNLRPSDDADHSPRAILDNRADGIPLGARDTVVPRLGAEWRLEGGFALRAGYAYRPTPLPRPVYYANAIDNDAHILSLGGGLTFGDPTGDLSGPVHLDLSAQLTALERRSVIKADLPGNPPGAYEATGHIWVITLDLRHDYF